MKGANRRKAVRDEEKSGEKEYNTRKINMLTSRFGVAYCVVARTRVWRGRVEEGWVEGGGLREALQTRVCRCFGVQSHLLSQRPHSHRCRMRPPATFAMAEECKGRSLCLNPNLNRLAVTLGNGFALVARRVDLCGKLWIVVVFLSLYTRGGTPSYTCVGRYTLRQWYYSYISERFLLFFAVQRSCGGSSCVGNR